MKTRKDILENLHDHFLGQLIATEVNLEQLERLKIIVLGVSDNAKVKDQIEGCRKAIRGSEQALGVILAKLEQETKGDREKMLKGASKKTSRRLEQLSND